MSQYLQITIIGVVIVFFALAVLYVIFNSLGRLFSKSKENESTAPKQVWTTPGKEQRSTRKIDKGGEEVAAITAAVVAVIGHANFKFESVEPVSRTVPSVWKRRKPTVYWRVRRGKN